uniref:Uncharacterized protein n=1 Tax=Oryza brachyantha TaxID=4533 RepID=J3NDM4_ORYBR
MADLESLDEVVVDQYDVFCATRALVDEVGLPAALISLLLHLGQTHEMEAELEMSLWRTIHNFDILAWHTDIAKARIEAVEAAHDAFPVLLGYWLDVQFICEAVVRLEDCKGILCGSMV